MLQLFRMVLRKFKPALFLGLDLLQSQLADLCLSFLFSIMYISSHIKKAGLTACRSELWFVYSGMVPAPIAGVIQILCVAGGQGQQLADVCPVLLLWQCLSMVLGYLGPNSRFTLSFAPLV